MAITRWARRAVLTATALAFALPFTTGTAQAEPIIQALEDNNVNVTIGLSNNNVDSVPVSLGTLNVPLSTGEGFDVNAGAQAALDMAAAMKEAIHSGQIPGVNMGAAHVQAVKEVEAAPPPAAPAVAAPPPVAEVAAPAAAPQAAPETAPVLESAVTVTDETVTVTDEPKGDDEGDDDEAAPSGCPNITALGILSVCLLPNLVQLHI
ncbi:hypothetical protein [Lentzea sp. NPDC004782]|uniref:hypothetical protein n=1 Tax=Lentzea sp. NPDC004782 TaxID=3154458 RepID=UPI0033B3D849